MFSWHEPVRATGLHGSCDVSQSREPRVSAGPARAYRNGFAPCAVIAIGRLCVRSRGWRRWGKTAISTQCVMDSR